MKINYKFLILLALPLFSNCKKDEPEPEVPKSNIVGSVMLYDEGVNPVDNDGMTVYLESISTSKTTTDTGGVFVLTAIPLATYTIVYKKAGYGTFKYFDFELKVANTEVGVGEIPSLGKLSTTTVTSFVQKVQGTNVRLFVSTDPKGSASNTRYARVFYSTDSGVSSTGYEAFSEVKLVNSLPGIYTVTKTELLAMGFSSGQTVYAKAYGESFWSNTYVDPVSGKTIFPNINSTSANAVSFVVP